MEQIYSAREGLTYVDAAIFFQSADNRKRYPFSCEVFKYWDSAREVEFAPDYADIEISHLPPSMIPPCAVVDVITDGPEGGLDFVYRFWGTFAAESMKKEMTGKSVLELPSEALCQVSFAAYQHVMYAKTALVSSSAYQKAYNTTTHEIFLRLPMSSNGVDVNVVMTAFEIPDEELRGLKDQLERAADQPET